MFENVGKPHDRSETPQTPSFLPNLQHKDVFLYTHTYIYKILQHIWVSTELKNHFFRTVPISSHKWLSSRALNFSFQIIFAKEAGGDGKRKGHSEKDEGGSCKSDLIRKHSSKDPHPHQYFYFMKYNFQMLYIRP